MQFQTSSEDRCTSICHRYIKKVDLVSTSIFFSKKNIATTVCVVTYGTNHRNELMAGDSTYIYIQYYDAITMKV